MVDKPWLLFDYDDTLGGILLDGQVVNNDVAYTLAEGYFAELMKSVGLDASVVEAIRKEVDEHLCRVHGFSWAGRYPEAMTRAYKAAVTRAGLPVSAAVEAAASRIGFSVFDQEFLPLPGALDTLNRLGPKYNRAIVTKGEDEMQRLKIKDSGVGLFIERIFVVGFKTAEEWQSVLDDLKISPAEYARTWAIGNAPKSDVNVPVRLGLNAIHVDQGGWSFEKEALVTPKGDCRLYSVSKIHDILTILLRS